MRKKIVGIIILMLVATTVVSAMNINVRENNQMTILVSDVVTQQDIWVGYTSEQLSTNNVTWLGYDDGRVDSRSGCLYPPMFWAIRLTNEELAPYNGLQFVATAWYHTVNNQSIPTHTYDTKIWIGNETRPITLLLNDTGLLANGQGWVNHTLSASITIDASKDYWIVIKCYNFPALTHNDYPMAFDIHHTVQKKSMWCHNSGNNLTETDFYQMGDVTTSKGAWLLRVAVALPVTIVVTGGFGVSAEIKNIYTTDLTNVNWNIDLDGDMIFLGKTKSGVIPSIPVGGSVTVKDFVLGFGDTGVVVKAGPVSVNATGTAFLFFVSGIS